MANNLVKVFWEDALIYKGLSSGLTLARKMSRGELVKEKDYVVIKEPITSIYNKREKVYIPDGKKHAFLFVPKGMIRKIVRS